MKNLLKTIALSAACLGASFAFAAYPDKPLIVDYKSGAGGAVGAEVVAKSPADGYTLMLANTGVMVINPALYSKLPYNTLKDFVPIARTAMQPLALLVNPKVPANNLKEFIAYAKARPGQVQFMAESIPQAANYHKQGKVRALAVTSRERNPALPDVPTVIESGVKGFEVVGFYGFLAPAGTPKDVVAKLESAFKQILTNPEIKSRMVSQGADPAFLGSDDFSKFLSTEMPRWAAAVKASGAKMD